MTATIEAIAGDRFDLWGANWSLYTAKVRPYLIKKGVEYVELNPSRATVFLACSGVARRAGSSSIFLAARSWQGLVRNGTKRDPGN